MAPLLTTTAHQHNCNSIERRDDPQVKVPAPEGKLKVVLPQLEIPANKTQYYCIYFKPPRDKKYHIYDSRQVRGKPLYLIVGLLID